MKILITLITLCTLITAQAQTYVTKTGDTLHVGGKVKIGIGSLANGGYRFIRGTFNILEAGQVVVIRKIIDPSAKKAVGPVYLKVGFGKSIASWEVNIDYALKTGEIEILKE